MSQNLYINHDLNRQERDRMRRPQRASERLDAACVAEGRRLIAVLISVFSGPQWDAPRGADIRAQLASTGEQLYGSPGEST